MKQYKPILETLVILAVLTLLVQYLVNQWLVYFSLPEINFAQSFSIIFFPTLLGSTIKYWKSN
jgi:hypothetical protein